MREYNLFVIKNEYYDLYHNRPMILFDALNKLYTMHNNLNYGITLYEQLCNRINIETLKYYLNNKYRLNNDRTFYIDMTFIELKPTRIIVKSKTNLPEIIKMFNCYNRKIFICDFQNYDYFWLHDFVRSKVLEYI